MATVYKVLGQVNPAPTTLTTLYAVPVATSAVISTIVVANMDVLTVSYRIAVRPGGAAVAAKHYLVFDAELLPKTSETLTLGITLGQTDILSIQASTGTVAFSAFGSEIS